MIPDRGVTTLTMDFCGLPAEVDRKCGRLLGLSRELLAKDLPHRICCLTGNGPLTHTIACENDLTAFMDQLLCYPLAREGTPAAAYPSRRFHIGGDPDEI